MHLTKGPFSWADLGCPLSLRHGDMILRHGYFSRAFSVSSSISGISLTTISTSPIKNRHSVAPLQMRILCLHLASGDGQVSWEAVLPSAILQLPWGQGAQGTLRAGSEHGPLCGGGESGSENVASEAGDLGV